LLERGLPANSSIHPTHIYQTYYLRGQALLQQASGFGFGVGRESFQRRL